MPVFKCKMCGGTIEFEPGASVGVCDSCGTKQTLPKLDDDRRANLYDRANHFRRNNEFDKAAGIYEQILNEDTTDAEAYWSLVLCQYGIEYVEDPATRKRVPTVNRAQFTSVFDDDNYKSALQYADGYQRVVYEEEANAINEIQKGILAISQKEEPFDVFICYKESDNNGRRTPDSVLANDLYHQLTQEGFKVFFARITLEDKLGTAYEPYIFAALNSAKVMVVLGTKPEYFNAVWVKNEWSRYLALVKQSGGKKVLIPAYKDMDPYDLPEEFSHLQAQDMTKLGFMQDLIRGIKKIAKKDEPKATVKETVVVGGNVNVAPLLKRAFLFLEDGNWSEADEYCEKVLDQDPENAEAYLGKLMAELRVRRKEDLADCAQPFDDRNNYRKAVRFGGEKLAAALAGFIATIKERNEKERLVTTYDSAVAAMEEATTEDACKAAAQSFQSIAGYKDADALAAQCLDKAECCRKNAIYDEARMQMIRNAVAGYESAIQLFGTISGWRDADEQIENCKRKIEEIKAKEEADRIERARAAEEKRIAEAKAKKRRRILMISIPSFFVLLGIVFCILWFATPVWTLKYESNDDGGYTVAGCNKSFKTSITIPAEHNGKPVTRIGDRAFKDCSKLRSVDIPDSVTSIWDYAFSGCSGLTSVTIPNGVMSIGSDAFSGCTGLKSVTIPNGVTSIGGSAFSGCTGLTSVTVPDSVTSIGSFAFDGCTGLTSVTIPDSVMSIEYATFRNCTGLTSVTIPDGVTVIGHEAFAGCTGLTSVTISDGVMEIGRETFAGCSGLTSITIPDSVTRIWDNAFSYCSAIASATIPSTAISSIPKTNLQTVVICGGTDIEDYAFYDCTGLASVTIGNGVTSIGGWAFYNCSGLTSITIGNSVTSVGTSAFYNCTGLASVTIGNGVTSIGDGAFYNCSGLTSVTIPDCVTSIGWAAFRGCSGLTTVEIGNGVTEIEAYTFFDCFDLDSITYRGTKDQWYAIEKPWDWGSYVGSGSCVIHCTDGDISY